MVIQNHGGINAMHLLMINKILKVEMQMREDKENEYYVDEEESSRIYSIKDHMSSVEKLSALTHEQKLEVLLISQDKTISDLRKFIFDMNLKLENKLNRQFLSIRTIRGILIYFAVLVSTVLFLVLFSFFIRVTSL